MKKFIITKDTERTAPKWLAVRFNLKNVKLIFRIRDGASVFKGVSIDGELAEVGDAITFDGKRLSVERR